MAKEKLITRTFQFTKARVKVIDRADDKAVLTDARVLGFYQDDEKLLEEVQKALPFGVLALGVQSKEEYSKKCSVPVEKFIEISVEDDEDDELKED